MQTDVDLSTISALVVDSSRYTRAFAISALQSMGLRRILEAGNGAEALEMLTSTADIHLVVIDRDLTPMSGIDFTRRVRNAGTALPQDVTILMTSGEDNKSVVAEARNAGVNEFMVKPVAADALYRRVRNALTNPKAFVRTDAFTGPDRRTLSRPPQGVADRRRAPPLPKPAPLISPPSGSAPPPPAAASSRAEARFPAGHLIFSDGDRGEEAYVVRSGRVLIFKTVDGVQVPLGTIAPGGVFGEMALIDDEPRMASARAEEDTVCSVIPLTSLKSLLGKTPDLVVLVLETLLHDIRKMGRELGQVRAALEKRHPE